MFWTVVGSVWFHVKASWVWKSQGCLGFFTQQQALNNWCCSSITLFPTSSHESFITLPLAKHLPNLDSDPQDRRETMTNGSYSSLFHNYAVCKRRLAKWDHASLSSQLTGLRSQLLMRGADCAIKRDGCETGEQATESSTKISVVVTHTLICLPRLFLILQIGLILNFT